MAQHPLRRVLERLPLGYAGKIVALSAAACAAPFVFAGALIWAPRIAEGGPALALLFSLSAAISLTALTAIAVLVSEIRELGGQVRACARLASIPEPETGADLMAAMQADLGQLAAKLESVRHRLANRHPVTGLSTREPLLAQVAEDIAGQARSATLAVIRFAQYDRLTAVDRRSAENTLQAFAGRLAKALGPRPLAQVDRDCFAVWVNDAGGPKGASELLQGLVDVLAHPIGEEGAQVVPDLRLGAAIYPNDGADGPTLLARAVGALGKSVRMANSRLAFHSEEGASAAQELFVMEQALRQAIAREELALHYQPVIDLAAGRVVGAEALLRWRHSELGAIPPARFLPVLEQTGLILEIGAWIFDRACADAVAFEELGLNPFKVGVNLSERQFRDPRLPEVVAQALRRSGLKPQRLELELTEAALMEDLDHTRRVFEALAAIGVSVAIDDFGAGASSLGDLRSLPFGKLKIDRAFVTDVSARHDSQAVCAALIELGRRLDIAVLAEGVETREEVEALQVMGCSLFQGFFFARPLPADKFARKVTDSEWLALLASPAQRQLLDVGERLAS
ncbi:MAG: GGDEF domain-containing protein [Caulobacteraceae bacterium]|nr:GGDEF domain-containing protein [Caulobacteraceae bacterium]